MPDPQKELKILLTTEADLRASAETAKSLEQLIAGAKGLGLDCSELQKQLDGVQSGLKGSAAAATTQTQAVEESSSAYEKLHEHQKVITSGLKAITAELGRIPGATEALHLLKNPYVALVAILAELVKLSKDYIDSVEEAARASDSYDTVAASIVKNRIALLDLNKEVQDYAKKLRDTETVEKTLNQLLEDRTRLIASHTSHQLALADATYAADRAQIDLIANEQAKTKALMDLERKYEAQRNEIIVGGIEREARARRDAAERQREIFAEQDKRAKDLASGEPGLSKAAVTSEAVAKPEIALLEKAIAKAQDEFAKAKAAAQAADVLLSEQKRLAEQNPTDPWVQAGVGTMAYNADQAAKAREAAKDRLADLALERESLEVNARLDRDRLEASRKNRQEAEARAAAAKASAEDQDREADRLEAAARLTSQQQEAITRQNERRRNAGQPAPKEPFGRQATPPGNYEDTQYVPPDPTWQRLGNQAEDALRKQSQHAPGSPGWDAWQRILDDIARQIDRYVNQDGSNVIGAVRQLGDSFRGSVQKRDAQISDELTRLAGEIDRLWAARSSDNALG